MKLFFTLAMGDVSATEAYEKTHCPHDTEALLPLAIPQTGPVVSYLCPALSITQPTSHFRIDEGQDLSFQGWAQGLAFLLHKS